MAAITLPTMARPREQDFTLVSFQLQQTPPTGAGPTKVIGTLGDRFRVHFPIPPMLGDRAATLRAKLLQAVSTGELVQATWPAAGVTGLGTPLVNGGSQLGSTLICDGFLGGKLIKAGTVFSVTYNSRPNIHMLTADANCNGSGEVSLSIAPMLRGSPANNAALEFVTPTIQGYLEGTEQAWRESFRRIQTLGFSILEEE